MRNFDVIVVGAGPAGATAAYFLGLNGVKTLLIDKGRFPRDKACGGGISTRLLTRFPYLQPSLTSIPVNWIHRVYLESPRGLSVEYVSEDPLYLMIRRYEFDNLLFTLAKEKVDTIEGALVSNIEISANCARVVARGGDEYICHVIIGADGANSIVARRSGLRVGSIRKQYAIDMMEETPYDTLSIKNRDTMYVYYGIQGHYGYGYIFPKVHHINLGVGCKLDYFLSHFNQRHYGHHIAFIEKLKQNQLVRGNSNPENFMAFPVPLAGPLPKTYSERVLLCGDAGGFVNAFTAEGIYYAMVSGECAATAAIQAIRQAEHSAEHLRVYEDLWRREIGLDLAKSVQIQGILLSDTSRIDRIVKAAKKDQKLASLLAGYATGTIDYHEFKRSVIVRALPLYLREKIRKILWGR
jgi:geranylgeranyl reductase family protein